MKTRFPGLGYTATFLYIQQHVLDDPRTALALICLLPLFACFNKNNWIYIFFLIHQDKLFKYFQDFKL